MLQQPTDRVDDGVSQLKALDLDLGVAKLVSPTALPHLHHESKGSPIELTQCHGQQGAWLLHL